jgi:hypothetical protein
MLSRYKLHEFNLKRDWSYVYILYYKFEIVYIGMTIKLDSRLLSHIKDKQFDSAKYILTSPVDAPRIERELISFYKPKYNTVHKYDRGKNPNKVYLPKKEPKKPLPKKEIIERKPVTLDEFIIELVSRGYKLEELMNVANRFDVQLKEVSDKIKVHKRSLGM